MHHQFTPDQIERFWTYVAVGDDCWLWRGSHDHCGYGKFALMHGRRVLAHRMMFAIVHGEIPDGKLICHACDNPGCVRPTHLWAGTNAENRWDASRKGRLPTGERHHWFGTKGKGRLVLTEWDVKEMRKLRADGLTLRELAERFGISASHAQGICSGARWKEVG